ncbi:pilus assembly protein CpaD [Sphingobium sp. SCG-1]|uniref:CpaD family pilus assembly protein n=1 Tax=Sphingobium sp. SCG-1 TaxID=2072936 RepID=UPI000CD6BB51|nr:CpaD family pilus assembly lipoprotein [Sphingobium sp. SCG-1]AUW59871.1 pilus assembly protein CpaD [Sphingobium sp. SCG-1]
MARNFKQPTVSRGAIVAGLCIALTSAAVLPGSAMARPRSAFNRGMESVRQPVVSYTSFTYDVQVGGGAALSPAEKGRLEGWLASINVGYGDRLFLGSGNYYGDAVMDIANVVARHGLLIEQEAGLAADTAPEGSLRLVVRRATARVPGCPDWSDTQETNGMGNISRNFGCGVNGSLAAMIANPEDLVRGQTGTSDLQGATSNRAIQVYRDKTPTGSGDLKTMTAGGN